MIQSSKEKIDLLRICLEKMDIFSDKFDLLIKDVSEKHKTNGGHIEYAYIQHFHKEINGLSKLFQYLLDGGSNAKYVFFSVRGSIEILLYLEHVIRLAKEDGNKILDLLSRDMAQSAAAISSAASENEDHEVHKTLEAINVVNKLLETDFDLNKIKPNSRVFPDIHTLCNKSSIKIKDVQGSGIYHIYVLYSESNHLRLSSQHSITEDTDFLTCWALEYFLEIYIRFYDQILNTGIFPEEYTRELKLIGAPLGLCW